MSILFTPIVFQASTLGTAAFLNSGSSAGQLPTIPIPMACMDLSVIAPIAFNAGAKTIGSDGTIVVTSGSYPNPAWITGLAYSKLSGAPTLGTAAASNTTAFDAAGVASTAQAFAIQRTNHTGTQIASTISNFSAAAISAVTWSTLTGKPTFSTVATSGAYADLSGLPSIGTQFSVDSGWTANSTVGDKTAALAAYSNGLNGTMVAALNVASTGTGTKRESTLWIEGSHR